MKFTGNYTIVVTPNEMSAEEITEEPEESEGTTVSAEPEDEFGLSGDSRGFFSDSIRVQLDTSTAEDTPEGYLKIPGVTIAKAMVQHYEDSKGRTKRVLKSADALRDMIEFGSGRPVTDEHPKDGVVMSRSETRGFIDNLYFTDHQEAKADIYVTCPVLKNKVIKGDKAEVSIGFYSNITNSPGIYNDESYDEIQSEIWLDHLAIVKNGRCSRKDGCGITDSLKPKIKIIKQIVKVPSAPAITQDSAATIGDKTRLINELHLVADGQINKSKLMKLDVSTLEMINDMVNPSRTTMKMTDRANVEHVDNVCARLFEK